MTKLYNTKTGKLITSITSEFNLGKSAKFSPDGSLFVIIPGAGKGEMVAVHSAQTGKKIINIPYVRSEPHTSFNSNGSVLQCGNDVYTLTKAQDLLKKLKNPAQVWLLCKAFQEKPLIICPHNNPEDQEAYELFGPDEKEFLDALIKGSCEKCV